MSINQNAAHAGIIEWKASGRKVSIYIGMNTNTGEDIVWQHVLDQKRPSRVTGRNIYKFVGELDEALNNGEAFWIQRNDGVIDLLRKYLEN